VLEADNIDRGHIQALGRGSVAVGIALAYAPADVRSVEVNGGRFIDGSPLDEHRTVGGLERALQVTGERGDAALSRRAGRDKRDRQALLQYEIWMSIHV